MLNKIKHIHYKDIFLYGFYGSYIAITSLAAVMDFFIGTYYDAAVDLVSVFIAIGAFAYYLKTRDRELASILLFWIAGSIVFMFVVHNHFNISIIFTLLLPMVGFILLSTRKMMIHMGIYFFILAIIFGYGYSTHETHALLYSARNMSAYIIALLFVLAFGTFYHVAIERTYVELEDANRQKTFLLKEIHHRVKNNLNLVASILGLQKLESHSPEVHRLIDQNKLRLESIAMAHEMLYVQDNLADIDFSAYVLKLTDYILQTNKGTENIKVEIEMIPLKLPIESMIQFGIMINELMINSIKYAFNGKGGTISLTLEALNNRLIFSYKDDGKGFDITNTPKGFGANLVEMTVSQLDAKMTIDAHEGTTYKIEFTRGNNENSHS